MTNKTVTKRALTTGALAVLACIAMLIGTTFAWFTDTASTAVNRIQSGKLDVSLEMFDKTANKWVSAKKKTLNFIKADDTEEVLWEPGATYALPELRIVNRGNLALKYRIVIAGAKDANPDNNKDDLKLLDVIDWTYSVTGNGGKAVAALDTERHLAAKTGDADIFDTLTIKGKMQTTAGNDYQDLCIDGIAITVYATQDTVESDSYNNQYDKFAAYAPSGKMYTVSNYEEAKSAFAAGGGIVVNGYIEGDATKTTAEDRLVIKYPSEVELKATVHIPGSLEATANWAVFYINADTTINSSTNGGILCMNKLHPAEGEYVGGPYVAHINGEGIVVTVNNGLYYGGGTTFNVEKGTLIVNGGFFQATPDCDTNDYRYTLNCIDENYKNGTANIIVKGGTFVNFDPSNNLAEGENTNYLADGYKVVSEKQTSGDIWYTVVPK